jgi:hypothetical protein
VAGTVSTQGRNKPGNAQQSFNVELKMKVHSSPRKLALLAAAGGGVILALAIAQPAAAGAVVYENLPTAIAAPPNISWHNASGPVIADDFIATSGGQITHLTWWGTAASSLDFEVVLQTNNVALGEPNTDNPFSGGLKQFVTATSAAYSIPGIFQFDTDVAPGWNIGGGVDYWLTVANFNNGWNWAEALAGPTVGSELFNAHSSTGPGCGDGGPHCGPWTDIHTDFAFRVTSVPEPASWAMMLLGFGGLGAVLRHRRSQARVALA